MASTYSPGLGIELPGTGDQAGVWGNTTNTNLGTLIEQAISGYVTQAVATGTDTTITIPNGATGVARNMYLELTGTGGASTNLIVPANKKLYFIFNNTSSGQVTVKVSGQTGISVPNGKKMILVSNGTDIVTAENYVASLSSDNLTLTGSLTLSGGTANGVLYLNGSKVATSGSALVFDGTNLGLGVTPSTWDSGRRVFQIGGNGALWGQSSGSGFLFLSNNLYYDGTNFRYLNTAASAYYTIASDSSHRWYQAVSGTAGNVITVGDPKMILDLSGNLGIGTASPGSKLHVVQTAASEGLRIDGDGSGYAFVVNGGTDRTSRIRALSIGAAYVSTTPPTNGLIVDGNVGIGTASPSYKLQVNGGRAVFTGSNENYTVGIGRESNTNSYYLGVHSTTNPNLLFSNNAGTTNLTLTYDGNLGLGVTPSAWVNATASQVGFGAAISSRAAGNTASDMTHNAFWDGSNWKYIASSVGAARYQMTGANVGSTHAWFVSAGGTAGNAITFTQALTLDASGNLLVGTSTSTFGRLEVVGGAGIRVNEDGAGTKVISIRSDFAGVDPAVFVNTNNALLFGTNNTERGRFSAGGNFGVGTSSPTYRFVVSNSNAQGFEIDPVTGLNSGVNTICFNRSTAAYVTQGQYALDFRWHVNTGASESARLTSGGDFWVGTATAISPGGLTANNVLSAGTSSQWAAAIRNSTATTPWGLAIQYSAAAPNDTSSTFLYCVDSGPTLRASIRSNGGIANYSANDVNLSDERVKTDIAPLGSMWAKFKALEIVTFKYKDQTHEDDNIGVIAQQVESVAPEFVDADGWGETPEDGVPLKSIYTADMYHAAIKALQEAMARIESLEAKVSALEAK